MRTTRIEGLVVGTPNESILIGTRVPVGMVWEITAAGIGTSDNITWAVDYSLNKAHATAADGSDWFIPLPVSRLNPHHHGTPMVALAALPVRFYEGHALMARANGLSGAKMDLFWEGIQYPWEYLERAGGCSSAATDYAPFKTALDAAADALIVVSSSVPGVPA
jgi:hypothetical protein